MKDRRRILAVSRAHALNNPFDYNDDKDFFCFPISEDVVIYSAVMMFQRFHHLLPKINEKIRLIAESGLLKKWQQDSEGVRASSEQASQTGHGSAQIKLKLEHIEGSFLVLVIGLGLSFVVFLLEHLTSWFVARKKLQVLKTSENILCFA